MNHLDLCSGIGGFSLAAHWAGYRTIGFVEIDPWCQRVIAKNFPGVPMHDDLKTLTAATVRGWIAEREGVGLLADSVSRFDGAISGEQSAADTDRQTGGTRRSRGDETTVDLITGGYPCQPFSLAGKRLGAEDDRHLWPYIAALVADLKPRRVLLENVYGHVSMGLDAVLSDLEALGYACGAVVVPACAVGAPHRRDRVWILADTERDRSDSGINPEREHPDHPYSDGQFTETLQLWGGFRAGVSAGGSDVPDSHEQRSDGTGAYRAGWAKPADGRGDVSDAESDGPQHRVFGGGIRAESAASRGTADQEQPEVVSGMGDAPDGLSRWLVGPERRDPWAGDWEAGCPRVTAHEVDRTHKLKALGNAIVPQVAYEILHAWVAA